VLARVAAARAGRTGRVAGVDINAAMLGVARSLPAGTGARIGWVQGSALRLPWAEASYDVVLCQLGLQFVPDQLAALAQMRRVLCLVGGWALACMVRSSTTRRRSRWRRRSIAIWARMRR
jgi:ubiquinone/menaquinone biosynthesis C-methylase UbiE